MRINAKIFFAMGIFLITTASVHAASPQEELTQMIGELQKTPADSTLREKVINFAHTLKPAPVVSTEAEKFEGRAQYAFKNAKSETDLLDAAREYLKAVEAAPWTAGYYYDLGMILEKANKPTEAISAFKFYLIAASAATDAGEVRKRIAGLEYVIERIRGNEDQRQPRGFTPNQYDMYGGGGKTAFIGDILNGGRRISLQLISVLYSGVWRNQLMISDITTQPYFQRYELTPIDTTFRLNDLVQGTPYYRLTISADGRITFGGDGSAQAEIVTSTSELLQLRNAYLDTCSIWIKNNKFYVSMGQGGLVSPSDGAVMYGRLYFESDCAGKILGEKPGWFPTGIGPYAESPPAIIQQMAEWAESPRLAPRDACLGASNDGLGWLASS